PEIGSSEDAARVAERLIAALQETMLLSKHTVVVTPSIGIAIAPTDGTDAGALLRHADLAMYFCKRRAPGSYAFFDVSMNEGALQRYTIESKLRGALERGELSLHYQPQISMSTSEVTGMEALLRWTHPELGVVPPSEFIPIAEASGLIVPIGEWVLRTACQQARKWHEEGLAVPRISVNVAARQFAMHNFAAQVAGILAEVGLTSSLLELEITESMIMLEEARAARLMDQLHAIGVSIAIDDFGTGYSNFQRLHRMAIDRLKMDRSFIRDLGNDTGDRAIAAAILSMARVLNVEVVAEGVETFAQFRFLQEHQCAHCQGFLLSRALPAGEERQVVDRGDAPAHQTALVELPVLVAVGAKPVTRIVVPLVGEAHRDPILAEGPDLLDEPVVELATPLAAQKRLDLGASVQKLGPISPHRVLGVGERDPLRVAGVPGVLGHPHLGDCALRGERRLDRGSGRGSRCGLAHAVLSLGCAVSRTRLTSAPASASSAARSSAKCEPAAPQTRNRMATNAAPRL